MKILLKLLGWVEEVEDVFVLMFKDFSYSQKANSGVLRKKVGAWVGVSV